MREKTERAEPIVDRHDDDLRMRREVGAVVDVDAGDPIAARLPREVATVDEHHHGQRAARVRRSPHVERQAIFAADRGVVGVLRAARLHALVTEAGRGANAGPRRGGLRRPPAQRPDRRRRIRDAAPRQRRIAAHPAKVAGFNPHEFGRTRRPSRRGCRRRGDPRRARRENDENRGTHARPTVTLALALSQKCRSALALRGVDTASAADHVGQDADDHDMRQRVAPEQLDRHDRERERRLCRCREHRRHTDARG